MVKFATDHAKSPRPKESRRSQWYETMRNPNVESHVKKTMVEQRSVRNVVICVVVLFLGIVVVAAVNMTLMGWQDREVERICYANGGYMQETDGIEEGTTCSGTR